MATVPVLHLELQKKSISFIFIERV